MPRDTEPSATYCPPGCSGSDYIEHVRLAGAGGRSPIYPSTVEQYMAIEAYSPILAAKFRPRDEDVERLGLPSDYGLAAVPISRELRRGIVAALAIDEDFARRLWAAMRGAE